MRVCCVCMCCEPVLCVSVCVVNVCVLCSTMLSLQCSANHTYLWR